MSVRLVLAFSFLVVAPLVLLGSMAWMSVRTQEIENDLRTRRLLESRLSDVSRSIEEVFSDLAQQLTLAIERQPLVETRLQSLERRHPYVRTAMIVHRDGRLLYPEMAQSSMRSTEDSLETLRRLARNGPWATAGPVAAFPVSAPPPASQVQKGMPQRGVSQLQQAAPLQKASSPPPDAASAGEPTAVASSGWHSWYQDQGLQLLHWQRIGPDRVCALIIERPRWISDIVAALPDTTPGRQERPERFALFDAADRLIYQWGTFEPGKEATALAEIAAPAPISGWQLRYYADPATLPSVDAGRFPLWLSLIALLFGVLAAAFVLLRDYRAAVRDASQRVSFVNHVSHELRTPLTNIRLYAELLSRDVPAGEPMASRLDVIQKESERLGRLVENVLAFARRGRQPRALRRRPIVPDELVSRVLDQFEPTLAALGLRIERCLSADTRVDIDPDIVAQVLSNLLTNVEKYAADGERVTVSTAIEGRELVIRVRDEGPGIPPASIRRIFEPFYRCSDALDAPAGTGIGLTIARDAAQRHGGSLECLAAERGACFECRLAIEDVEEEG